MIDALQHHTTWNRDLQGRVTSKVLEDNTSTVYVYETSTSRLKQMTDSKNQVTHYQYWADDNLKQVSYTNATIATPTVNYTYDPIYNRVATMADGTGTTTYAYHPVVAAPSPPQLGATQLASINGALANDTITYSYDELGRVLNRAINAVSSSQSYDTLGRVNSVTNPLGQFSYAYDGVTSRLTNITGVNGDELFQMNYTYYGNTGDRRLKTITNTSGQEGFLSSFLYTYLAEGEIQKIKRTLPAVTTDGHTYDLADQLTAFGRASQSGTLKFSYRYDPAGNRTQEAIVTAVTDFGYNTVNELITRSGAQGAATFTYDSNGSLTSDGTRTFEWDGANRLVAVNIGTHRSEFSYDGIDRRTRIVEKDNSVVTSDQRYVWCGGEICEERDATGATVQKRFYEQGEQVSGANFYYTFDHLGSVRELLEFRGVTVTKFDYDPWGRQTKLIGTQDAAFGYAGYFQHQPSGLLLTWYRAYDVNQARWISRDPIGEVGGVNLYAYVENDPVGETDPFGLHKGDKWYGRNNRDFQNWFHRCWKQRGDPDATKEGIEDAYQEWLDRGSPKGGRCWDGGDGNGEKCPQREGKRAWRGEGARQPHHYQAPRPWTGPTQEELRLREEAARWEQRFWETLLYESVYFSVAWLTRGRRPPGLPRPITAPVRATR